jgi:hypothetical protein
VGRACWVKHWCVVARPCPEGCSGCREQSCSLSLQENFMFAPACVSSLPQVASKCNMSTRHTSYVTQNGGCQTSTEGA